MGVKHRLKKYTKEDIDFIKSTYNNKELTWDMRVRILMEKYNKTERTIRRLFIELDLKNQIDEISPQFLEAQKKQHNKETSRFIITWAQNNTPIHEKFLKNIEVYAKHIGADIHVIAGRYKNPTSVFTDKKYDTWHSSITKYLDANRHDIHKYVSILSDIKVQPTATNPMQGLNGVSGHKSCIIGAPKLQLEVSPALDGYKTKVSITTGSCTLKNYTDSKSGKKGEFHHQLGFAIVEIKDKETFFIRQVSADDKTGNFSDLIYDVLDGEVKVIKEASSLIMGDIHSGYHQPIIIESTLQLLKKLKVDYLVLHDIFDGHSISHHEANDPFKLYKREQDGTNSLKGEIDNMLKLLERFKNEKVVIVRSNHDDFLDRWLINANWKNNIKNAKEYIKYSLILLEGKATKGIIPFVINEKFPDIKTLGRNDSFKVKGWELGQHGDIGTNGSRGSLEQYRKLNTKIVVGHSHTPGRKEGALQVGTSTHLRQDYNKGASSWMHSHVLIHKNGKAQHLLFFDGEFTTLFTL